MMAERRRRNFMSSLAIRLTLWYATSTCLIVATASGLIYWALLSNLDRQDDQFLSDQVHILRDLLAENGEQNEAIRQEIELEAAARRYARVYVRLLATDGNTIIETPGMAERLPTDAFPVPKRVEVESAGVDRTSTDGNPFRLMTATYSTKTSGNGRAIQIALDRAQQISLIRAYRGTLLAVLGLVVLISIGMAYWIAHRGIRPINEVTQAARRIRSTTLHERIEAGAFPSELLTLVETFNEMLDRLQESFDRLSQFSADIAHELRTPVNNIRGEAEVALSRPRGNQEYREVLASELEEAARLSSIIDNLLLLARSESPQADIDREWFSLHDELERLREFYDAVMLESEIHFAVESKGSLRVHANRSLLQRAIGNLIENAIRHTSEGGTIAVAAFCESDELRIEIADNGSGIAAEHLPHLFDRFYRVQRDRSIRSGGSGLGLAIVRSIVRMHGGEIVVDSQVNCGTTIVLRLPGECCVTGEAS